MLSWIASCLHPRDLLNLSRSSKHLRVVFFHRSSVVVWKSVLRKAGFPECPGDISEPQYTSLMFDTNFCMVRSSKAQLGAKNVDLFIFKQACNATTENVTCDFGLRLRLCSTCWGVKYVLHMLNVGHIFTCQPTKRNTWRVILPVGRGRRVRPSHSFLQVVSSQLSIVPFQEFFEV